MAFFRNLLLGERNELKNRHLRIGSAQPPPDFERETPPKRHSKDGERRTNQGAVRIRRRRSGNSSRNSRSRAAPSRSTSRTSRAPAFSAASAPTRAGTGKQAKRRENNINSTPPRSPTSSNGLSRGVLPLSSKTRDRLERGRDRCLDASPEVLLGDIENGKMP